MLINRNLLRIEITDSTFSEADLDKRKTDVCVKLGISKDQADYFVVSGKLSNNTYSTDGDTLKIGMKDGSLKELSETSEIYNLSEDNKPTNKYFITSLK